ncbi:hypothetical protein BDY21DRAFT_353701 [Lineolata rhizophorae]|uniref:Uncharacterized protein n=1 Tax=Lineolata rhizophorae TaxID=578093 RepID=A0A6A6NRE5_9PEZI|nr:hypothetical protein BDY21DRAFT_353701 [Lineolata rhizophorae]
MSTAFKASVATAFKASLCACLPAAWTISSTSPLTGRPPTRRLAASRGTRKSRSGPPADKPCLVNAK